MKRILLIISVMSLFLLVSCSKSLNCRCAVNGTQNVRVITIDSHTSCADIYYVQYNASDLPEEQGLVDSVYCTDYPFDVITIDSSVTVTGDTKKARI